MISIIDSEKFSFASPITFIAKSQGNSISDSFSFGPLGEVITLR